MFQSYEVKHDNNSITLYLRAWAKEQIHNFPFMDLCTDILVLSPTMYLKLTVIH